MNAKGVVNLWRPRRKLRDPFPLGRVGGPGPLLWVPNSVPALMQLTSGQENGTLCHDLLGSEPSGRRAVFFLPKCTSQNPFFLRRGIKIVRPQPGHRLIVQALIPEMGLEHVDSLSPVARRPSLFAPRFGIWHRLARG